MSGNHPEQQVTFDEVLKGKISVVMSPVPTAYVFIGNTPKAQLAITFPDNHDKKVIRIRLQEAFRFFKIKFQA